MRVRLVAVVLGAIVAATAHADEPAEVRAMLAPQAEATLASDLSARIDSIPFRNGERFRKGDTLVAFDCAAFRAILAEARAAMRGAVHKLENARKLAALKSAGQLELDLAEAEVEQARARAQAAAIPVDHCLIRAPYPGRVVERKAQPHESAAPGQPLIAVLDDSRIEVRMLAPSAWLRWLKPGAAFRLTVDETGLAYHGRVVRLGARVDAVSQSVAVVGLLDGAADGIIAGMSGNAAFKPSPP